jgi:hypothetical protein
MSSASLTLAGAAAALTWLPSLLDSPGRLADLPSPGMLIIFWFDSIG